jgi:hypothetical protein
VWVNTPCNIFHRVCQPCHAAGVSVGPKLGLADGVAFVGASLLVFGVGLLSTAAGLIAAGVVLVLLSVLLALRHG